LAIAARWVAGILLAAGAVHVAAPRARAFLSRRLAPKRAS
jgi:hypothetical protein